MGFTLSFAEVSPIHRAFAPTVREQKFDISELAIVLPTLDLSGTDAQIAAPILAEISTRLTFLLDVGLDYLSLDRAAPTLAATAS